MRKLLIVAAIVGVTAIAFHPAARADTLSDWLSSLFGFDPTGGDPGGSGIHSNDGPGSGTGIAD